MTSLNIKPVLRSNKMNSNGQIPIYFRFTKDRKVIYKTSGIWCNKSDWNTQENKFWIKKPTLIELKKKLVGHSEISLKEMLKEITVNPLSIQYNNQLTICLSIFENKKSQMFFSNKSSSVVQFKKELQDSSKQKNDQSFISYWKSRIEYFKNIESSTSRAYEDTLKIFQRFLDRKI